MTVKFVSNTLNTTIVFIKMDTQRHVYTEGERERERERQREREYLGRPHSPLVPMESSNPIPSLTASDLRLFVMTSRDQQAPVLITITYKTHFGKRSGMPFAHNHAD